MSVHSYDIEVEVAVELRMTLGESPIWDGQAHCLRAVDIVNHLVFSYDPRTEAFDRVDVGQPVSAIAPRASGGLIMAVRDGFASLIPGTGATEIIVDVEVDNSANRMNDGKCDTMGRFFAGTMSFDSRPKAGALYRLDPDHTVAKILSEITEPNGLDWSVDDRLMYFVDTATQRIDVFDYDRASGTLSSRRPFVEIPKQAGMPDGLTVDSDGFIWVALWGGGAVHRYSPDGRLATVIKLPVSQVTSCTFGGTDMMDLYITSASIELSADQLTREPHAGSIFRCRPGVSGRPARHYKG